MKIFISWSGDLSKNIAEIFRQWIPGVIQAAKPYYSPDDITKGTRWNTEISKELDASKIGIICLTKENLESTWIMFEAGALSKNIEKSKVVPLLFGIDPSDVQGPLVQFQAAKFSKTEMKKVIKMINAELGETGLSSDVLDSVFEMWWTKLETQIKEAEEKAKSTTNKDMRTERDLLEEVLSLTRELSINRRFEREKSEPSQYDQKAIEDLVICSEKISESILSNNYTKLFDPLKELYRPIGYFADEAAHLSPNMRKDLYSRFRRNKMYLDDIIEKRDSIDLTSKRKVKLDVNVIKDVNHINVA